MIEELIDTKVCVFCGKSDVRTNMHSDHIVPKALGGSDEEENRQWLCPRCNLLKRDSAAAVLVKPDSCFVDLVDDHTTIYKCRVPLKTYVGLPCECNVRSVDSTSKIYRDIVDSALTRKNFYDLNKGIRVFSSKVEQTSLGLLVLFKDLKIHGVIDGGHTNSAILSAKKIASLEEVELLGSVSLEIMVNPRLTLEAATRSCQTLSSCTPVTRSLTDRKGGHHSTVIEGAQKTDFEFIFNNGKDKSQKSSVTYTGLLLASYYSDIIPQRLYSSSQPSLDYLKNDVHGLTSDQLHEFLKSCQALLQKVFIEAKTSSVVQELRITSSFGNGIPLCPAPLVISLLRAAKAKSIMPHELESLLIGKILTKCLTHLAASSWNQVGKSEDFYSSLLSLVGAVK